MLCDRFGFRGAKARTLVRDLSGGERRRLQLMRLLMDEPNVLLLDEPTNDLDIDTLTALEDLLDGWPGTLVVVSHDRYFVERVCDDVYALTGDGGLRHLPGGIEQYVERAARRGGGAQQRRRDAGAHAARGPPTGGGGGACAPRARRSRGSSARWSKLERARGRAPRGDGRQRHRSRAACASCRTSSPPGGRARAPRGGVAADRRAARGLNAAARGRRR